jgi:hypothetical protein
MTRRPHSSISGGGSVARRKKTNAKRDGAKRYTEAEKRHILETAKREGLSGPQAAKRFKINMITFYRWRGPVRGPKAKGRRPGRPRGRAPAGGRDDIRSAVRAQVQRVLPQVIREQVKEYLAEILGRRGPGRPRTRA